MTKCVLEEESAQKEQILSLIREYFSKGSPLYEELKLFKSVLSCADTSAKSRIVEKVIAEAKNRYDKLDKKEIFSEQSKLIRSINHRHGTQFYNCFIPNYKDIASIGLYLQNKSLSPKKRLMLEDNLVRYLGRQTQKLTEMKHLDNLEYRTFVNKFNTAYEKTLQMEQKNLLTNYIVSFSDNGVGLKTFLNEEIGRLKEAVEMQIVEGKSISNKENFKKVKTKLDNYAQTPINQQMVEEIFYIQDLIAEVSKNAT